MASKVIESKKKYLIIGLLLGILIATFLPDFLLKSKSDKNHQYNDIIFEKNSYDFAAYSKWPPFLTDSTFDLV